MILISEAIKYYAENYTRAHTYLTCLLSLPPLKWLPLPHKNYTHQFHSFIPSSNTLS